VGRLDLVTHRHPPGPSDTQAAAYPIPRDCATYHHNKRVGFSFITKYSEHLGEMLDALTGPDS
jgi:hypothetical protein